MSDGELEYSLRLDNRQFLRSLRGARGGIGRFAGGIAGTVAGLAGFAAGLGGIAAAAYGLRKALDEAGAAQRLRTTLQVLLRDAAAANRVFEEMQDFSDQTPFEPRPIQEAGVALLAAGFHADNLKTLLTDVGDLASVMGADINEVARVFARLNTGDFGESFERLRDFGISRQLLEGEGLVFDRGGSYQGTVEEAMSAVRSIIQRRFGGTMDAVSQTWEGKLSTMSGKADSIFREFGTPIIDSLIPVLDDVIGKLEDGQSTARAWGEEVADMIDILGGAASQGRIGELLGAELRVVSTRFGAEFDEVLSASSSNLFQNMLWAIEALAPPAILIFRSIAASFASAIAQMIPAPLLNAQRQIAKPQAYEDATDLARERGLIDEAGRATEAGRAFLIKRNPEDSRYFDPVDAGLGKGTGRVIRRELRDDLLRERFTTDGLTRMYQDQSIEEGSAAGQAFLKAGRDLDALFQQNRQPAIPEMIRKPRDRSPAVIEAEAARDAIRASLMDPRQQLEAMGFLTPLFDMGPSRPGSPLQSASAAGDEANGESLGAIDYKTQSDRLAKMGGLLGGSAVQLRHDERTARATETMVQQGETANRHLAEISREGRRGQGATWQS